MKHIKNIEKASTKFDTNKLIVADIDLTTSDMEILLFQSYNNNNLTENRKIRTYIGSPLIKDCDKNGPTYKIYQYLIDNKKGENK